MKAASRPWCTQQGVASSYSCTDVGLADELSNPQGSQMLMEMQETSQTVMARFAEEPARCSWLMNYATLKPRHALNRDVSTAARTGSKHWGLAGWCRVWDSCPNQCTVM